MAGAARETLDSLRHSPLLSRLSDDDLGRLLDACQTLELPADRFIFSADQPADRFFVILAGRAKIFQLSPRGDEQILHLYGRGQSFGEAAMLAGGTFPAHASSVDPCRLLVVTRAALRKAIENNADLALAMMAGLSLKLREFTALIERLSLKEVPARLASWLLAQRASTGRDVVKLSQTKRQLAAQLGTVPETLSRALRKLAQAGMINVSGPNISLLDTDAMQDLAGG